ncbi:DE-cadherin-like [Scyliorhinus torazame]|uniref:DE-cadherin-like n=1 Tax=Scyliorhinus torazame TaxID=75743 RepID=UPI003B5958E5
MIRKEQGTSSCKRKIVSYAKSLKRMCQSPENQLVDRRHMCYAATSSFCIGDLQDSWFNLWQLSKDEDHVKMMTFMQKLQERSVQEKKAKIIFDVDPASVLENQPIGTVVAMAKDDILDVTNPQVTLMLDAVDGFDISSHTGHITTLKVFNFELETMATHVLQVELATSNYSDTKFLRVLIQNVNEPPKCEDPKFVAGTASVDVADNIDKGTSIYHIHAEDEDNGDILKYKIESKNSFPTGCGNVFSIDQRTGVVFVNSTLDYDAGYHKCRLAIQVEDQHNLFCQGTLVVNVRDMNDEPPVFK